MDRKLDGKDDLRIRVIITSDCNPNEAAGVYYSNEKYYEDGELYIGDELIEDGDLCVKYLVSDEKLRNFATVIVLCTLGGIVLIAAILLLGDPKPELLFALLILILGLIMMIIINPSSPPDELSHYEVCMQLSNKLLHTENYRKIDSIYLKYGSMYGHYNISAGYLRFLKEFLHPVKLTGKMENLSRDINEIYMIQYLPNAIGLSLGRLLKLNMITTFYLGRLTGLLFYVLCVYLSIRKATSYKFLIGMIAALPMSVQIAISITYDTFIIGLSMLTLAYFIRWYFNEEKIRIVDYILVFLICLALAPAKIVYGFFSFLFFLVPAARYGGRRNKILLALLLCLPALYQLYDIMRPPIKMLLRYILFADSRNLILDNEIKTATIGSQTGLYSLNGGLPHPHKETYSFWYMIKYPMETLMIFYRTVRYRIKFWFYGAIGRTLSGDTLVLPLTLVHALVAVVFAVAFVREEQYFSIPLKLVMILICITIGMFTMIGMFVSWTKPDQEVVDDFGGVIIEGIQGRYFSPVLPYFFSVFSNKKLALPQAAKKYILLAYLLIYFEIVVYVLSYTFVN